MPILKVVVAGTCIGCVEALRLLGELHEKLPELQTELLDLDVAPEKRPEAVVAVPSYLIDGKLIFTGNPTLAQLLPYFMGTDRQVLPVSKG